MTAKWETLKTPGINSIHQAQLLPETLSPPHPHNRWRRRRGGPPLSQESPYACSRARYNQVQPEASWQRDEDSEPNKDMEFGTQVEIKIHGFHPCPDQNEGLRLIAAKHNKIHSALPETFQKTRKCGLNYNMQVRPSAPGPLQQCWQALLTHITYVACYALMRQVAWTCCRGSSLVSGQQSQCYSWDTASKG